MTPPRYIWRELNGYAGLSPSGQAKPTSDFMVLDSFYGYAVVYYDRAWRDTEGRTRMSEQARLQHVKRVCSRFNAEERAEDVAA